MKRIFNKIDEWKIIQDKLNFKDNRLAESLMSIGNGHMGIRGNYEEFYSQDTHQGTYIAGVWFPDKTKVGWWKNGYPDYFGKVPNAVDFNSIDIYIDDIRLDLGSNEVLSFYRELDMQNGILNRNFKVKLNNGKEIEVRSSKFLSVKDKELAVLKYEISSKDNINVRLISYLNNNVKNEDSNYEEIFWLPIEEYSNDLEMYVAAETKANDFGVETFQTCCSSSIKVNLDYQKISHKTTSGYAENEIVFNVKKDEVFTFEKYTALTTSRDYNKLEKLVNKAKDLSTDSLKKGFNTLLEEHTKIWHDRWKTSDVEIKGDILAQQGIRYNLFQLFSTYYGEDSRLNIGPKGFTGEKYGGATYWDTEAYCLPLYLATTKEKVAKNLLIYRYKHLKKAKENAKKIGLSGALYPMVTFNGVECHNEWEITFEEIHRNGSIVYAIYNYLNYTNDYKYLYDYGYEIIVEIARFWLSRVHFSIPKNKYVIHGVTGPNEYENNVNNNWYTNYLAKWNLNYAVELYEDVLLNSSSTISHIKITKEELKKMKKVAENLYLPFDEKRNIFIQNDDFLDKELISVEEIDSSNLPLNQNWSWDKILRSCYIKQADVLQGIYYFIDAFSKDLIKQNFEFYKKYTVHESSLSASIHSIIASSINSIDEAYSFYQRTARLDLDNYNNDTEDGLHITSMPGSWLAIVHGFAKMRSNAKLLSFSPILPQEWDSYSFSILYQQRQLKIRVEKSKIIIVLEKGLPLDINVYNKKYNLESELTIESKEN